MLLIELFEGDNRIGTGVRLDEIPQQLKHLKVLGRGATSIVLDYDPKTVLILTRDSVKAEWLTRTWGINLGEEIDRYNIATKHHIREMGELPVYVIKMPKLRKISGNNKKIVNAEIADFFNKRNKLFSTRNWKEELINYYLNARRDSILIPLMEFLSNYSPEQYEFDLLHRNFMETLDGTLVLTDPIVAKEMYTLLMNNLRKKEHTRYESGAKRTPFGKFAY